MSLNIQSWDVFSQMQDQRFNLTGVYQQKSRQTIRAQLENFLDAPDRRHSYLTTPRRPVWFPFLSTWCSSSNAAAALLLEVETSTVFLSINSHCTRSARFHRRPGLDIENIGRTIPLFKLNKDRKMPKTILYIDAAPRPCKRSGKMLGDLEHYTVVSQIISCLMQSMSIKMVMVENVPGVEECVENQKRLQLCVRKLSR